MNTLDLNRLSNAEVKMLNEISASIKEDFNVLTKEILDTTDKSLEWLLHPLISRNPYQSNFYLNVCILIFTIKILSKNTDIKKVIPQNNAQEKALKKHFVEQNINVFVERSKPKKRIIISLLKSLFSILKIVYLNILSKDKSRIENINSVKKIILVDTFILQNSIDKGNYIDRYYPCLINNLSKERKKRLYWLPTISGKYNGSQLKSIYKNSNENIIFKHDFLRLIDYWGAITKLFRLSLDKKYGFNIYAIDVSSLIISEFSIKRFHSSSFDGILNYYFVKRLKDANADVSLLIDWNENQPIDKGLIKGFRDFYPEVYIKGYQGYIISTDFNFYIQPTDYEVDNGVIPDEICVVGQNLEENVKKFSRNILVSTAPAFRFKNVYESYVRKDFRKKVLIALPIGMNESKDIINLLLSSIEKRNILSYELLVKPHPLLKIENLITELGDLWLPEIKIIDGDFNSIVSGVDLLIGSTSTTLLETISRGIPVIVIASSSGLTQNPIPSQVDNRIWKLCYNQQEVGKAMKYFISLSDVEKNEFIKIGIDIKYSYFEPVSRILSTTFTNVPKINN
jgi:hypothetical protein